MSSLACQFILYRPEYSAKGGPLGIEFWKSWKQKWNMPMHRAVRVDLKNKVICLV